MFSDYWCNMFSDYCWRPTPHIYNPSNVSGPVVLYMYNPFIFLKMGHRWENPCSSFSVKIPLISCPAPPSQSSSCWLKNSRSVPISSRGPLINTHQLASVRASVKTSDHSSKQLPPQIADLADFIPFASFVNTRMSTPLFENGACGGNCERDLIVASN